jgi:hypothetical protein
MSSPPSEPGQQRVEAARYALLRRLAAAMRQRMVVQLQPIGLLTQLMERRLREVAPDVARIAADMDKVQGSARSAVATNLDMVSWLAPEPGASVTLETGARECIDLLGGPLALQGVRLRLAEGTGVPVARHAVRTLLSAVLLALADAARAPAELVLLPEGDGLQVQLQSRQGTPETTEATLPPYRALAWHEVEALGQAEQVRLARSARGVGLRFAPAAG